MWTPPVKSLAYNICGVNTTNIQPLAIYLFNIIHIVHNLILCGRADRFALSTTLSTINPHTTHKTIFHRVLTNAKQFFTVLFMGRSKPI
jgi:hypothetical protein